MDKKRRAVRDQHCHCSLREAPIRRHGGRFGRVREAPVGRPAPEADTEEKAERRNRLLSRHSLTKKGGHQCRAKDLSARPHLASLATRSDSSQLPHPTPTPKSR